MFLRECMANYSDSNEGKNVFRNECVALGAKHAKFSKQQQFQVSSKFKCPTFSHYKSRLKSGNKIKFRFENGGRQYSHRHKLNSLQFSEFRIFLHFFKFFLFLLGALVACIFAVLALLKIKSIEILITNQSHDFLTVICRRLQAIRLLCQKKFSNRFSIR